VGTAIHSVRAVPVEQLSTVAKAAEQWSAPLHVHLSEQRAENEACLIAYHRTPAQLLEQHGALSPRTTAVHATHLSQVDIEILGDSGTCVCMCPTTERDLADGIGAARSMFEAGSPITLGSDSQAVIDLFEEARAVELDERLSSERRGHWPAADLLFAATETGHASLGRPDGRDARRRPGRRLRHGRPGFGAPGRHRAAQRGGVAGLRGHLVGRPACRRRRPGDRLGGCPSAGGRGPATTRRRGTKAVRVSTWSKTLLVTGIGELTVNDPQAVDNPSARPGASAPEPYADAAFVVETAGSPGTATPSTPRPRTSGSTCSARPSSPASWTATRTWSSRATGPAEFAARMTGTPYSAGGIRTTVAATRAADDEQLRGNVRRLVHEMARQGTTTVECKTGYGLTVEDELRALRIAKQECGAATFLGAHVVPAEYAESACPTTWTWCAVRCSTRAPHTPTSWTSSASAARSTRRDAPDPGRRVARGIGAALHANQLGPRPRRAARGRVRRRQRGPLHVPRGIGTSRRSPVRGTVATLAARSGVFHKLARILRRTGPDRRGSLVAIATRLQSRLLLHVVDAVLPRARRPRDAHVPG
jgi:hypothetical protein